MIGVIDVRAFGLVLVLVLWLWLRLFFLRFS